MNEVENKNELKSILSEFESFCPKKKYSIKAYKDTPYYCNFSLTVLYLKLFLQKCHFEVGDYSMKFDTIRKLSKIIILYFQTKAILCSLQFQLTKTFFFLSVQFQFQFHLHYLCQSLLTFVVIPNWIWWISAIIWSVLFEIISVSW